MDIKEVLLQWFINFLIKKLLRARSKPYLRELREINLLVTLLKLRICQIINSQTNYINQLLKNSKKKNTITLYRPYRGC